MKSKTLFLVIALTAAAAIAAEPTPVQNDAFSLTLPTGFGQFAKTTQSVPSPKGKKTDVTTWISDSPTGEKIIVVQSVLPGKVDDASKLFSSARDGMVNGQHLTLDNEQKVSDSTEMLNFHAGTKFLRSRFVLVGGDHFYQVFYLGNADQSANPTVSSMFDSFTPNAQPVAQATTTAH
jgi:hypothetical protein